MNITIMKITYILFLIAVFFIGYHITTNAKYTYYSECDCMLNDNLLEDYYLHHDDFFDDFDGYLHVDGDHLHKDDHQHKH